MGSVIFFTGLKRSEREVDCLPPSGAEIKNEWSCTSAPRACVHGEDSDNFTFVMLNTSGTSVLLNCIISFTKIKVFTLLYECGNKITYSFH
jgi:hypothetical protein